MTSNPSKAFAVGLAPVSDTIVEVDEWLATTEDMIGRAQELVGDRDHGAHRAAARAQLPLLVLAVSFPWYVRLRGGLNQGGRVSADDSAGRAATRKRSLPICGTRAGAASYPSTSRARLLRSISLTSPDASSCSLAFELEHGARWHDVHDVERDVVEYIDGYYNPIRRHSHNRHLSPVDFECWFLHERNAA